MICEKDNINYKTIVSSINNIFINADKDISKDILKKYNVITRKSKLSFKDVLLYCLEYTKNYFNNNNKNTIIAVDGTYTNTNIKNIKDYLETTLTSHPYILLG